MLKSTLLAAAAISVLAAAAHAQPQTTVGPAPVEGVVVTARTLEDTLPEQLAQTGVKVEIVPGAAIRNGGYADVASALQMLAPGLFVLPENGPFSTNIDVSLLGSRSQDVLWLVDGVRINNRLFANILVPLDTVPSGIVDHLEVLDGGQSLFYGTQATAGAVNIVTRPFTDSLAVDAQALVDTNTRRHLQADVSDKTALGQFVVYGSSDKSDGYRAFRPQDYQPSAGDHQRWYQNYTEGLKYQVDPTDQLRLQGSYQRTDGTLDLPFPYRIARDIDVRADDLATVKIDYQPLEKLGLFVKGYWHNWTEVTSIDLSNPLVAGATIPYENKSFSGYKDYGVNALAKLDVTRGVQALFGYDLQKYGGRDDTIAIAQTEETVNAGFGQLRLTPELIPNLNLAGGFRYNAPSRGPSSTIWNASGRYQLPMGVYAKAEVGTNFLLPSAEQLFANDVFEQEKGNPNLKPEQTFGGDFTLGAQFDVMGHASRLEVTGFARDITNEIDLDPATFNAKTNQYTFDNLSGTTRTRGGQVEAQTALTHAIKASLSYSYNSTKDSTGRQLDNVPLQLMKAGLDWSPLDSPFGASANMAYTGAATTPYTTSHINYGEYATVDISGRYFFDPARHHQFNLAVQNLFDREYGKFYRGCGDVLRDFPLGCSRPYAYQGQALPRTVSASYTYRF